MNTIADLLRAATTALHDSSPTGALDAQVLLSFITGASRATLLTHGEREIAAESCERFYALLAKRQQGTPIAYLVGEREFFSLPFLVNEHVLIPRPETEELVDRAVQFVSTQIGCSQDSATKRPIRVLDLGTGSGCIAVALAVELQKRRIPAQIVAVDKSTHALAVAQTNARRLEVEQIEFLESDWFSALGGVEFDLILTNPPYIPAGSPFVSSDTHAEPPTALYSGADGADAYRQIFANLKRFLASQGAFIGEHGIEQAEMLRALACAAGFSEGTIFTRNDLSGRPRFIEVRLCGR